MGGPESAGASPGSLGFASLDTRDAIGVARAVVPRWSKSDGIHHSTQVRVPTAAVCVWIRTGAGRQSHLADAILIDCSKPNEGMELAHLFPRIGALV